MKRIALLLLSVFVLASCKSGSGKREIIQSKEIVPQKEYALLIVESDSCIYCKQLEKDIKTNQELGQRLSQMDLFRINYDSNAKVKYKLLGKEGITTENTLARSLGVNSFPYIFFYDKEGNIILRLPGYVPPKTLSCIIDYVKSQEYQEEQTSRLS